MVNATLRFSWGLALLLILLVLAGCSRAEDAPDATTTARPTATATRFVTPEPTPTRTPTPEPTPVSPGVVIADQPLDESGVLVAGQVSLPAPGWLVIYRTREGAADDVIGRVPLAAGVHDDVEVTVDIDMATEALLAGVHFDVGTKGVFDFPGVDEPFPGEPEAAFTVDLQLPFPIIEADDQDVTEESIVTLRLIELLEPTWVVIHADEGGQVGPVIGSLFMESGVHEDVSITINWRAATPVLYAVLHEDDGEERVLEFPDADRPLLRNGQPIVASFNATYPPDVLVLDQPVIDGTVTIERAISNGPGYVAIYNEEEGQPGFIIGTAALQDGLNEEVTVTLLQSAITVQLFARLHEDTEAGDAFNFPGQDQPVRYNGRLPNAAAFRTDAGAHVFINDQRLGEGDTVTVATIVTPVNTWAAIHTNADGLQGRALGQVLLTPGIHRDVVIELENVPETDSLFLVLYQDLGEAGVFEESNIDLFITNNDTRPVRVLFGLLPPAGN